MKFRRRPVSGRARTVLQILFVVLAILLGARHVWGTQHAFDASCPFGGVATLYRVGTEGTFLRETGPSNLILLGALLLAALLTGRAFCGWTCPLGTVQEWLARGIARLTGGRKAWLPFTPPPWLDRSLRWLKYVVLGLVLWASVTAVVPPLIPFCPYRTLFTLNLGAFLGWGVLLVFVLASLTVERFWCRYACPLGAVLALTNRISLWRIRPNKTQCVSCGLCDRACPMGLDVVREVERGVECIRCLKCVHACPRPDAL